MPFGDGSQGPPGQLDRPPSLPPEVQPSTFNSLAGQQDPSQGAGPSAGGMQMATIVGQLGMQAEMLILKLAQLVPGTEAMAGQVQQLIRQMAMAGLMGSGQGPQGPPQQGPPQGPMGMLAGGGGPQGMTAGPPGGMPPGAVS